MKLSDMILKATAHDTASPGADRIIALAHETQAQHRKSRTPLRIAAVIAAALCLMTVTLYAAGVLS